MPRSKSAEKQVRVAGRRQVQKKAVRSLVKTNITSAEKLISAKEEGAKQAVLLAVSSLDKAAGKKAIHPNNASRRKSRLMKKASAAAKASK